MIKKSKLALSILLIGLVNIAFAATPACYLIMNKSADWSAYTVTINVYNTNDQYLINTYVLTAQTKTKPSVNTMKVAINCSKYQTINLSAAFSPPIWQNLANKKYQSKLYYNLQPITDLNASTTNTAATAPNYTITVNFPDDYSGVPALIGNVD